MASVAILIGNANYKNASNLPCCLDDVKAMKELLEATQKFEVIEAITDAESATMQERIIAAIDQVKPAAELFFYFTGHGDVKNNEFFFCATDYDGTKPNQSGLSENNLLSLLRSAEAELVVTVIDACHSGTQLIKDLDDYLPLQKGEFNSILRFSSCLADQQSLTGDPLSKFTQDFIDAALKKPDGIVYYSDIAAYIRDCNQGEDHQIPYFISQCTMREKFSDTAKRFDELKAKMAAERTSNDSSAVVVVENNSIPSRRENAIAVLHNAEKRFADKSSATGFIKRLFDKLVEKSAKDDFGDFFTTEVISHSDYYEKTTKAFIIKVLSSEKRQDTFVTAMPKDEFKHKFAQLQRAALGLLVGEEAEAANYELTLNCDVDMVQIRMTMTPRFKALKRFTLVVSCAPSLEFCYVFEILTQHILKDWGTYEIDGQEIIRRWYKINWDDHCDSLVDKIFDKMREVVQQNIETTAEALAKA